MVWEWGGKAPKTTQIWGLETWGKAFVNLWEE